MKHKHHTLYAVGTIVKAFGVKGDVVIRPMTDSPERFKKLKRVRVGRREEEAEEYTIESVNVEARGVRLKLREVPDRTAAERLVRSLVFVDEKQRVIPAKGSYFIHDIVGLRVVDERDMLVGVVKEVIRMPAQDIYVVEQNGHEWMVPAVKEFVTAIDIESKTMRVRLIEGMGAQR